MTTLLLGCAVMFVVAITACMLRCIHMNPDSIRIESGFVQSSSRLIRIESESHSHEQLSSFNNGACSTLYAYHFHCQKKTHRSFIFAAVSGSLPASSPAISRPQTLSELWGIAAKWNINPLGAVIEKRNLTACATLVIYCV